jgi:hypothetical protein
MSKLTDVGVKETTGLKLQENTESTGVPKEETNGEKSGQSVEKSHEYKMARTLTSDVNLMDHSMQWLSNAKNCGGEEDIMFDSHCIHFGHFYRLFCAGRQHVILVLFLLVL